ncbi:glycoside hydrolase [Aestuariibaculum suncheonense]|uniref:Xylanase n=1 Tax=Aestuariibaculum suncheonense TaxID=1028745 RepID=A0A8J6UJI7_9FLAO|nr:glycoside hydrolase [Aestuariibaculum suncheonense]MBD0834826.1 xylanase [Aestuariibaculum suncheonense]
MNSIKKVKLYITLSFIAFQASPISAQNVKTKDIPIEIEINTKITYQTIHNFGASDAWSTQFVGKYWPESSRKEIAKLLFSTGNKVDGSPEGIGLTAWRFNIGAGSADQGKESSINDVWRQSECFLNEDQTYNWNKQEGQQWFLKAAKEFGVKTFIGFVNSPPIYYTENQKAWSGNGTRSNLLKTNYKTYADFLSEVVKGIHEKTGIMLDYISPFNEPQWEWECCKQEGSPWANDEIFQVVKAINTSFEANHISSQIELTEAAKINYLYTISDKPHRGNQIDYFFNKASKGYVGDLKSVAKKVAGHSYFTTWDSNTLINTRKSLSDKLDQTGLEYWMTEYCILEDNSEIKGGGRDLGIDAALYVAKVIHSDLVFANASAWHWWLAISPYDYKDGLIYIDKNTYGGRFYESKMLWALGHYSRFIKPGMKRVASRRMDGVSQAETISEVLHSVYQSDDELVIVFVNQLHKDKTVKLSGLPKDYIISGVYLTNNEAHFNLKKMNTSRIIENIPLPKRSLVTCILKKNKS